DGVGHVTAESAVVDVAGAGDAKEFQSTPGVVADCGIIESQRAGNIDRAAVIPAADAVGDRGVSAIEVAYDPAAVIAGDGAVGADKRRLGEYSISLIGGTDHAGVDGER